MNKKKGKRRVIFTGADFEEGLYAAVLAAQGKSARYIESKTKYSKGMIYYRTRFLNIKISDWRNGKGELSKQLEQRNTDFLIKKISHKIDNKLK